MWPICRQQHCGSLRSFPIQQQCIYFWQPYERCGGFFFTLWILLLIRPATVFHPKKRAAVRAKLLSFFLQTDWVDFRLPFVAMFHNTLSPSSSKDADPGFWNGGTWRSKSWSWWRPVLGRDAAGNRVFHFGSARGSKAWRSRYILSYLFVVFICLKNQETSTACM